MTVYFVGAGPGSVDLITVRAAQVLAAVPVCLYAGSIIPKASVDEWTSADCKKIDTASIDLETIINIITHEHAAGNDIARLHSGDPAIHSAIYEQRLRVSDLGINTVTIPGVSAFASCAASADTTLTRPNGPQSVVITRWSKIATPVPQAESLAAFARTGATLVLHLSARYLEEICAVLTPIYGGDCPCLIVSRASRHDEVQVRSTLTSVVEQAAKQPLPTALMIVGRAIETEGWEDSATASVGMEDNVARSTDQVTMRSHLYSQERPR